MYRLDVPLLKKRFSKVALTDYPDQEVYANLPSDLDGSYQPMIIGGLASITSDPLQAFLQAVPTILIDVGIQQAPPNETKWRSRKFKITQTIRNPETGVLHGLRYVSGGSFVYKYEDQKVTLLIEGTHYTFNAASLHTEIHMVSGAAGELKEDAEIRVSSIVYKDDTDGTFTGIADGAIYKMHDVLHFLMVCMGIPTSEIDIASFTELETSKQGVGGSFQLPIRLQELAGASGGTQQRGYLNDQTTLKEVAETVAFSCAHIVIRNASGKYELTPIEAAISSSDVSLIDIDIEGWEEHYRLDNFANRIIVQYYQIPAGAQTLQFIQKKKKKKKKKKPAEPITLETGAFLVVRNSLTRFINGVGVLDDFLYALRRSEIEVIINTFLDASSPLPQGLATYFYEIWNRAFWTIKFKDISGSLRKSNLADRVIIHRIRSAFGDISSGKRYWLRDMLKNHYENTIDVEQADEVKIFTSQPPGITT